MNDRIDRPTYDGPHMLDVEPPAGVRAYRASCWCGVPGHPRTVAVARRGFQLGEQLRDYRCPTCGGNAR